MLNSIEELRIFCAIFETKSIRVAAQAHNLTPAAGSKRLVALENRLGSKLFYRTTRTLSPTHAGEKLYMHAQRLLSEVEKAEQDLDPSNVLKGKLKITASAAFTQSYLLNVISHYMDNNPDINIEVISTDGVVNLTEHSIDLAIRHGPSRDSSLIGQKLAESKRVLCASPSYLAKYGYPEHPQDLLQHKTLTVGTESIWTFVQGDKKEQLKLSPSFASSLGDSVLQMAELGHGVTIQSDWHVRRSISQGKLVLLLEQWSVEPSIAINILYPSRKNQSLIAKSFISFLKEWVHEHPV